MKKVLLSLAVVAVAAASCQKDVVESNTPMENITIEESVSPYAVSEEEAIERLNNFMSAFDGNNTRSSGRKIRSIACVKCNEISTTRSAQAIDAENLLYIVEFEDGQGSAILGADERVEPVYAVLDNSTLSIDDFNNAANGQELDNIETITAGLIANAAIQDISTCNVFPDEDFRTDITYDTTYTTILEEVFPFTSVH